MSKLKNNPIGITMGDPSGIGPEIIAKAIRQPAVKKLGRFTIIGDLKIFKTYCPRLPQHVNFIDLHNVPASRWTIGRVNRLSARASLEYLNKAAELLRKGRIKGLVTAPLCKEAMHLLGLKFHGHTEYLADLFNVQRFGMMFVSDRLKTMLVTRHVPLARVSLALSAKAIYETLSLADEALKKLFKIKRPIIAVCGLNPHAGEGGTIGKEEIKKIVPALKKAKSRGIRALGPLSGDTAFNPQLTHRYDCVVAMYHDQGLIAVKTLYWQKLVNLTLGLPFIRTSPAHGTAFDIAGKNIADPSSMVEAIKLAAHLSRRS